MVATRYISYLTIYENAFAARALPGFTGEALSVPSFLARLDRHIMASIQEGGIRKRRERKEREGYGKGGEGVGWVDSASLAGYLPDQAFDPVC